MVWKQIQKLLQSSKREAFSFFYDDFDNKNHTIKHFVERINIYNQEEFDYKLHKVQM